MLIKAIPLPLVSPLSMRIHHPKNKPDHNNPRQQQWRIFTNKFEDAHSLRHCWMQQVKQVSADRNCPKEKYFRSSIRQKKIHSANHGPPPNQTTTEKTESSANLDPIWGNNDHVYMCKVGDCARSSARQSDAVAFVAATNNTAFLPTSIHSNTKYMWAILPRQQGPVTGNQTRRTTRPPSLIVVVGT